MGIEFLEFLSRPRVHQYEGTLVAMEVGRGPDVAIVGREKQKTHFLLKIGGENGTKSFVFRVAI